MATATTAENLQKPVLLREAFLTTQGQPPMRAWAAARTNDNGFVIAGSAGLAAWAAKTDSLGNVIWNYVLGLQDQLQHADSPQFHGVVSMPDGTTYLCGYMPRPLGSQAPWAMLMHLDSVGRVLSQKFMPTIDGGDEEHLMIASGGAMALQS